MSKRKIKRVYIDGDGKKHNLELIEVDLRKGSLEDLVETALTAEEDDRIIKKKSVEVKNFIRKTSGSKNALKRWYELGKILQFVDNLKLKGEKSKREAFQRLFKDLRVDPKRNPSVEKITRYPRHMYNLSKIPKKLVFHKGMTWSRWFDILEYKTIWGNHEILMKLVKRCCDNNWDEKRLRKELQTLNRTLKEGKHGAKKSREQST